jgi:exopolyphosphatase/guanosine-5'-triphosphate,3'-diphosphate pyrophosphatase
LSFESISSLEIDGLSERRQPVFIGGLAILLACFKALDLERMLVSPYALREGLLHDLLGRLEHRDPRDKAVTALMSRFAVDQAQVERVRKTALDIYDQIAPAKTTSNAQRRLLAWAAELHEIGLSLSHSGYHHHSAYLTEASDMAGFSRQEQIFLATMVGLQRRDIPEDYNARLPKRLRKALQTTLICIRLAWIFCRSREDEAIPAFRIRLDDSTIYLALQEQWMDTHPLTVADLEYEQEALAVTGLKLRVIYLDD